MGKKFHTARSVVASFSDNRVVFVAIATIFFMLCSMYVTLIHQTIRNVAARQLLETEMSMLNTKIGELEFRSISMKNDVTIDRAYALGFNDADDMKFVSRKSLSSVAFGGRVQ